MQDAEVATQARPPVHVSLLHSLGYDHLPYLREVFGSKLLCPLRPLHTLPAESNNRQTHDRGETAAPTMTKDYSWEGGELGKLAPPRVGHVLCEMKIFRKHDHVHRDRAIFTRC